MLKIIGAIVTLINLAKEVFTLWKSWLADKQAGKVSSEIDKSVETGDQTHIEEALGSTNAGKPSKEDIPDLKVRPVGEHGKE